MRLGWGSRRAKRLGSPSELINRLGRSSSFWSGIDPFGHADLWDVGVGFAAVTAADCSWANYRSPSHSDLPERQDSHFPNDCFQVRISLSLTGRHWGCRKSAISARERVLSTQRSQSTAPKAAVGWVHSGCPSGLSDMSAMCAVREVAGPH